MSDRICNISNVRAFWSTPDCSHVLNHRKLMVLYGGSNRNAYENEKAFLRENEDSHLDDQSLVTSLQCSVPVYRE